MKNRKMALFFGVALILGLVYGCAGSFTQIVYREQVTSMATYKIINDTLTQMRADNMITDDGWKNYSGLANNFIDSHKDVSKAMAEYKRGETPQSAIEALQKIMLAALDKLRDYYISKVPADQRKPLF